MFVVLFLDDLVFLFVEVVLISVCRDTVLQLSVKQDLGWAEIYVWKRSVSVFEECSEDFVIVQRSIGGYVVVQDAFNCFNTSFSTAVRLWVGDRGKAVVYPPCLEEVGERR